MKDNKPKDYKNGRDQVDCPSCWRDFDIDNWKKPFWHFEQLTFRDWNNYKAKFVKKYNLALNLSRQNRSEEEFIKQYRILHSKLVDENLFDRDDEMHNLYSFLERTIESFEPEEVVVINATKKSTWKILSKKWIKFWLPTSIAAIIVLGFVILWDKEWEIIIDDHKWKIVTPRDKFDYKRYEIFNRPDSSQMTLYLERQKYEVLELQELWEGSKWNGTYRQEKDGEKNGEIYHEHVKDHLLMLKKK